MNPFLNYYSLHPLIIRTLSNNQQGLTVDEIQSLLSKASEGALDGKRAEIIEALKELRADGLLKVEGGKSFSSSLTLKGYECLGKWIAIETTLLIG